MKRLLVITAVGLSLVVGCGKKEPGEKVAADDGDDGEIVGDMKGTVPQPGAQPKPPSAPAALDLVGAAEAGDVAAVKKFLADGADVNMRDPHQATPLIAAASMGHPEVVRTLITAKPDLNAKNKDGNTALLSAAFLCRTESVKLLVEAGADLNAKNNFGSTALDAVSGPWEAAKPIYDLLNTLIMKPAGQPLDYDRLQKTRPEIAALLREGTGEAPPAPAAGAGGLFTAVAAGDLPAITKQLEDGVNVNAKEPAGGSTPLMLAAMSGQVAAAKLLIEKGADVKAKNTDGNTALHTAAFFCKADVVTLLLEKGADVNAKNSDGETALGSVSTPWAEAKGVYELLGGLLQLELDLKAIEAGRPKIAEQLRQAGGK